MTPLILEGNCWKFGHNIPTDLITPTHIMLKTAKEMSKHVLETANPDFPKNVQPGDIIVAGRNFGCSSGRALAAKGLTEVPSGGDAEVFAIETTQSQQTLDTFYNGFGGGRRWGGFGGFGDATTTVETYKVGTLVVDLFDAKTEKLIWRSSSSDTLSDKADKNTKNLDKGVNKMFQHFPPAPSAKH